MPRLCHLLLLGLLLPGSAAAWPAGDDDGDRYEEPADCDDRDPAVHPDAPELENGIDDDCDGLVDEGTPAYDDDGDGLTEYDGDCDDADASAYPEAQELADGRDNDCDGVTDEGTTAYDDDGDGFSEEAGDCDDTDAAVHPEATEADNGVDDDCDGTVDPPEHAEPLPETSTGCASVPSATWGGALLGMFAVIAGRRRR